MPASPPDDVRRPDGGLGIAAETDSYQPGEAGVPTGGERAGIAIFKHEDFQFGYEIALGSAYRG
jgi:hypothetical protein